MTKKRTLRWIFGFLALACLAVIWGNSMTPGNESGQMSGSVTEWINSIVQKVFPSFEISHAFVRKAAHFTEFAILGALLAVNIRAFLPRRVSFVLGAIPCAFVIASIDETIQFFVKGRTCSFLDVLLDTFGATVAVLIAFLIFLIKEKRKEKENT